MWYIAHRMPEENLVRGSDKIAQLPTFCSNWNKYIDQILVAPQDEYNFALPVYEISSIDRWTKGRIALIGDAAHAFGPVIGQGCSLAMEDAYILASCISNSSQNISQGLEQYEFIRKSIVSELHGFENKQQTMRITNNPLFIQQRNQIISSSPVEKLLEPIANLINPTIFQQQVDASKILTL
jgi:2-polyprenyl-6-methoxyphenol hydroxylase-like FAD-dependent oxidoreductase